jgi:CubicO group peptidase (beta-lactamase class C family)
MGQVSVATHEDATLMIPTRFSLGFMKSMDNRRLENAEACSVILSDAAFGHVGAGGSIGFADPECRMSFGYSMNRMGLGILLNDRGQSLVDGAYRSLGYRSDSGGVWDR